MNRLPAVASAFAVSALAWLALTGCATTHEETRDECGQRCSTRYETCSRNAFGSDSLHFCGVEADRCAALCPSKR